MIDYGSAPTVDDLEVIVFGPGYGEAIAVHLGSNQWMLVDSCIDPNTKSPAALSYLQSIGVPQSAVRVIVATHWHDDHVAGLTRLVEHYTEAELHISGVFTNNDAAAFIAAYSGLTASNLNRGSTELYRSVTIKGKEVFHLHNRSIVVDTSAALPKVRVTAFTPVQQAVSEFATRVQPYIPTANGEEPINNAPRDIPRNAESVVLHIEADGDGILLGSDLEEDQAVGWSIVVASKWCIGRPRSSLYKVAHHGSETGEHPQIWSQLLRPANELVTVMTPFRKGSVKLPKGSDTARIKALASETFLTSAGTYTPTIQSSSLKRLKRICKNVSSVNNGFGAVRFRKKLGGTSWVTETFGKAAQL